MSAGGEGQAALIEALEKAMALLEESREQAQKLFALAEETVALVEQRQAELLVEVNKKLDAEKKAAAIEKLFFRFAGKYWREELLTGFCLCPPNVAEKKCIWCEAREVFVVRNRDEAD